MWTIFRKECCRNSFSGVTRLVTRRLSLTTMLHTQILLPSDLNSRQRILKKKIQILNHFLLNSFPSKTFWCVLSQNKFWRKKYATDEPTVGICIVFQNYRRLELCKLCSITKVCISLKLYADQNVWKAKTTVCWHFDLGLIFQTRAAKIAYHQRMRRRRPLNAWWKPSWRRLGQAAKPFTCQVFLQGWIISGISHKVSLGAIDRERLCLSFSWKSRKIIQNLSESWNNIKK